MLSSFFGGLPKNPIAIIVMSSILYSFIVFVEKRFKILTKQNAVRMERSILGGILWWAAFLYVQKGLNPDNKGDLDKFYNEAFYGGLATAARVFVIDYVFTTTRSRLKTMFKVMSS